MAAVFCLARIAELYRGSPDEKVWLRNDAAAAVFADAAIVPRDPKLLGSLLYALTKLESADSAHVRALGRALLPPARAALAERAEKEKGPTALKLRTVAMLSFGVAHFVGSSGAKEGASAAWARATVRALGAAPRAGVAPEDIGMIASALATARAVDASTIRVLAAVAPPRALATFPHAAIVSLSMAASASLVLERERGSDETLAFCFSIAEEMSVRLAIARETALDDGRGGGSGARGRGDGVDLRGLDGVNAETRAAIARARSRSADAETGESSSSQYSSAVTAARSAPLSPRAVVKVLNAFTVARLRPPQLFGAAALYLPLRMSEVPAPTVAQAAWTFARSRFESAATPAFWAAAVERAVDALAARDMRGGDVGTVAWATTMASIPAGVFVSSSLAAAAAHPASFALPALAQILFATGVQRSARVEGVSTRGDAARVVAVLEHVLRRAEEHAVKIERGGTPAPSTDPDAVARWLCCDGDNGRASAGVAPPAAHATLERIQGQLYTAVLSFALSARGGEGESDDAEAAAVIAAVPPRVLSKWRNTLVGMPTPSRLHADVSRVLQRAGIAHSSEVATPEGLLIDIVLGDRPSAAAVDAAPFGARSASHTRPLAIEVQGPAHFTSGYEAAAALISASGGARKHSLALSQPKLSDAALAAAVPLVVEDCGSNRGDKHALVPTLRTRAKRAWLLAAGYDVVEVDFLEWAEAPSTEEKMELLARKGVPIDAKHF